MAILTIREYPDPILSAKAKPVGTIGPKELRLIQDMIETMYQEDGVGLAAPQVGILQSIIVVSPQGERGQEKVYINPEILKASQAEEIGPEGCLSLPGVSCDVRRPKRIQLRALDMKGKLGTEDLEDFTARVVQHEMDHLSGVLLIDRLDFNQRQMVLGSYQRL